MDDDEQTITPQRANGRKSSTSEVPMADLKDTIDLVGEIRDKALENASMPEVAKGCGFSHASSTPFARKIAAARHFGLLHPRGTELTQLARNYFKPTVEDAEIKTLIEAIQSVAAYPELISQYSNKKLNPQIIANWFAGRYNLNDQAASVCARAFILSVKFAKYVSQDDTLHETPIADISLNSKKIATEDVIRPPADEYCEGEKYVLVLDRDGKRRFIVQSPPTVSQEELERIKSWLSFQLIVERSGVEKPT
jgi:hypothetical protein